MNYRFNKFREHIGHAIECVCYGLDGDVECVSIECVDCNVVLIDETKDEEEL
jgi:hypothetical protein